MAEMRLADFLRTNMDAILRAWVRLDRSSPAARQMNVTAAIRDHAREILRSIAEALEHTRGASSPLESAPPPDDAFKAARPRGESPGALRLNEESGIGDTIAEFRLLRTCVLQCWTSQGNVKLSSAATELIRFNEAFDHALANSVAAHLAAKEHDSRLFNTLLSSSPDLNYIFDLDGKFIYANNAFADLYGRPPSALLGMRFDEVNPSVGRELLEHLRDTVATKSTYRGEMPCVFSETQNVYEYLLVPVFDQAGEVEAIAGTARDITERKAAEERSQRSANYDFLTGLPNRSLFRDRLDHEVKRSIRTALPVALLFLDLDGFKEVNDRLGHDIGDRLLQDCAQRIVGCVRGTDTVARLGGDEFTVVLSDVTKLSHIETLARDILKELARPFSIARNDIDISGSIGIALIPEDANSAEELMRSADQAMYMAKRAGRNCFRFFTRDMRDAASQYSQAVEELRHALHHHEFIVHYQPIVDLAHGKIVKAEALLRWQHPQAGLKAAHEFLGLAEDSALIGDIDDWVLGEALRQARQWSALLGATFQISVNKSAVELSSKASLTQSSFQLLTPEATPHISVELKETILLPATAAVRNRLELLHQAGVQLMIDNYGTGYASLVYLRRFGIDYLKLNQALVHDLAVSEETRTIAETIITSAHRLGVKIIAEGVETADQRNWLQQVQCDYAQGDFYSKPLPEEHFERLLASANGHVSPHAPGRARLH